MLTLFELALQQNADITRKAAAADPRAAGACAATRSNPEASEKFLNILTSKHNPERVLRLMKLA